MLEQGEAKLAKGSLRLALQGIGTEDLLSPNGGGWLVVVPIGWQSLFVPIYACFY